MCGSERHPAVDLASKGEINVDVMSIEGMPGLALVGIVAIIVLVAYAARAVWLAIR